MPMIYVCNAEEYQALHLAYFSEYSDIQAFWQCHLISLTLPPYVVPWVPWPPVDAEEAKWYPVQNLGFHAQSEEERQGRRKLQEEERQGRRKLQDASRLREEEGQVLPPR
jgi:hypothetical protein